MSINENCNYCDAEIYDGDDIVHEKETGAIYCDEECLVSHIRKHAREYAELLFDQELVEKTVQK